MAMQHAYQHTNRMTLVENISFFCHIFIILVQKYFDDLLRVSYFCCILLYMRYIFLSHFHPGRRKLNEHGWWWRLFFQPNLPTNSPCYRQCYMYRFNYRTNDSNIDGVGKIDFGNSISWINPIKQKCSRRPLLTERLRN
jgi:hypothetical protein